MGASSGCGFFDWLFSSLARAGSSGCLVAFSCFGDSSISSMTRSPCSSNVLITMTPGFRAWVRARGLFGSLEGSFFTTALAVRVDGSGVAGGVSGRGPENASHEEEDFGRVVCVVWSVLRVPMDACFDSGLRIVSATYSLTELRRLEELAK